MTLRNGSTFNGISFLYKGSINSSLKVYPLDSKGKKTGTTVPIDKETIDFIKRVIDEKGTVQMGACRDNPSPNSLGKMLYGMGKSPQFLSYILPLLEEESFLTHYKDGGAYWVNRRTEMKTVSDKVSDDNVNDIRIPNKNEFIKGCKEFEKYGKRDAMYKVATFLISHYWAKPSEMADALGVLLLTWNQAFYRYGSFDFDELEKCIKDNLSLLEDFRKRTIFSFSTQDEGKIKSLFNSFLKALKIAEGKAKGRLSPVAVAKALHLLAPNYFPLWDYKIAWAYGCYYKVRPADEYLKFCDITKTIAEKAKDYIAPLNKTLVKLIDEYNYSKYTQGWI